MHASSNSTRPKKDPCTYANCGGPLPSNYRGCIAFTAKQNKKPHKAIDKINQRKIVTEANSPLCNIILNDPSYAAKASANLINRPSQHTRNRENRTTQNNEENNQPSLHTHLLQSLYTMVQQMANKMQVIPELTARITNIEQKTNQKTRARSASTGWRQPRKNSSHD